MENNILEGAKFGTKYIGENKSGRQEYVYCCDLQYCHKLVDKCGRDYYVNSAGEASDWVSGDPNIICRYQEKIDEEKLEELANDYSSNLFNVNEITAHQPSNLTYAEIMNIINDAYETGYKQRVKEE